MLKRESWPYEDTPALVRVMTSRYRRQLLDSLPHPADGEEFDAESRRAYRFTMHHAVEATRELHAALESSAKARLITDLVARRSGALAALQVMHRHVVALALREFEALEYACDDETLVALAEQSVDRLVEDVGDPDRRSGAP
jgi:hypothetical protein